MKTAEISNEFLIDRLDPNYPPHHKGDHLEETFIKFWEAEGKGLRKLIPIHWTAVYNYRFKEGFGRGTPNGILRDKLRNYLKTLDPNEKYFIVCTHDDAPTEDLPPNTLVFGAGGNSNRIDIPIPLTCSEHEDPGDFIRTIPVSFVGSMTHPIRHAIARELYDKEGVFINGANWTPEVPSERADLFKKVTQRSIFSLCPRGYGVTSYRLYESMQLGAIPVYVSDKHMLPWSDEIDWSKFSIVVSPSDIPFILQMTLGSPASKLRRMQDALIDVWHNHFSIEATCKHIVKRASYNLSNKGHK